MVIPDAVNLMAGLFVSLKVISSNLASKLPALLTVISYSILSPGVCKLVLKVALNSSKLGSPLLLAVPTIFLLVTLVIFTFQLLVILLVPWIFNTV